MFYSVPWAAACHSYSNTVTGLRGRFTSCSNPLLPWQTSLYPSDVRIVHPLIVSRPTLFISPLLSEKWVLSWTGSVQGSCFVHIGMFCATTSAAYIILNPWRSTEGGISQRVTIFLCGSDSGTLPMSKAITVHILSITL